MTIEPQTAGSVIEARVLITHDVGLHARPSVKLTKLAKAFAARIELSVDESGPWVDAKSIVKVMATKASKRSPRNPSRAIAAGLHMSTVRTAVPLMTCTPRPLKRCAESFGAMAAITSCTCARTLAATFALLSGPIVVP